MAYTVDLDVKAAASYVQSNPFSYPLMQCILVCESQLIIQKILTVYPLLYEPTPSNGKNQNKCPAIEYRVGQKTGPQTHDHNSVKY